VILDIGGMVLAGGGSSRLGADKTVETVGDKSLLERVVLQLSFLDSEILLVTAQEMSCPWLEGYPRLKKVTDIYPGNGPLGGIYTGLELSGSFYNLAVAGDMPFLNRDLLGYMAGLAAGYDLVVPRLNGLLEPLHAVYSRACLAPMEQMLKQGIFGVNKLFPLVRVRYVEAEEIDRFDPAHLSFFNINTKSDLAWARGLLRVTA
jgi:molybdopterin-guanine dinucleotide biosynthesis protein A